MKKPIRDVGVRSCRTGHPLQIKPSVHLLRREYFTCPPETIGDFALELGELGIWRQPTISKTPDWQALMRSRPNNLWLE
jgi:hypothetical protein